ncbi:MAG: hypothetical protein PW786_03225 [Arachidicoccus sp.]|nr:hypothetical protein [Arachidicoccus sp.]
MEAVKKYKTKKNKAKKNKAKKNVVPLAITISVPGKKTVSAKQVTPSEIKALRNSAYKYLA